MPIFLRLGEYRNIQHELSLYPILAPYVHRSEKKEVFFELMMSKTHHAKMDHLFQIFDVLMRISP